MVVLSLVRKNVYNGRRWQLSPSEIMYRTGPTPFASMPHIAKLYTLALFLFISAMIGWRI